MAKKGIPNLKLRGDKSPLWKGGITKLGQKIKSSFQYKQWRSDIFKRDNWTCQTCFIRSGKVLHPHHIKAKSIILKENNIKTIEEAIECKELWDLNNGITLCKDCHKLTENYGNKKLKYA